MYIVNVTNVSDNITSNNMTDYDNITHNKYTNILNDYDNLTLSNFTNNKNLSDMFIPALLLTTPCGLSFLCMLSLMIDLLFKPLFNKC